MTVLRRTAATAVASFAIVLAVPAVHAEAAKPLRFETLASINGAKMQACRIPTKATQPVKIKVRINATKAKSRVNGIAQPTRKDISVGKNWKSGWVKKGKVSKVGTVKIPRGAGYALSAGLGTGAMGNGTTATAASIRTCR